MLVVAFVVQCALIDCRKVVSMLGYEYMFECDGRNVSSALCAIESVPSRVNFLACGKLLPVLACE